MKTAWVVIGANYGDEGKGQKVHDIISTVPTQYSKLVVRYSGGAQAGHTVTEGNKRHVFQHFGAGTMAGVPTWLSDEFIVNPLCFVKEHKQINDTLGITPVIDISPECIVTTPYDMLVNIHKEAHRGTDRHGSCGMGIFETITRNKPNTNELNRITWADFADVVATSRFAPMMERIRQYCKDSCVAATGTYPEELDIDIVERFHQDVQYVINNSEIRGREVLETSDVVVFEGSQGLLLDEKYGTFPYLTPSSVGIEVPNKYCRELGVEPCVTYVSRPYMTRHGAGPLEWECTKEYLGIHHPSETNVYNVHQANFRYGILNVDALVERCVKDSMAAGIPVPNIDVTCESHIVDVIMVQVNGKLEVLTHRQLQDVVSMVLLTQRLRTI